jgi:hypothetical protein
MPERTAKRAAAIEELSHLLSQDKRAGQLEYWRLLQKHAGSR